MNRKRISFFFKKVNTESLYKLIGDKIIKLHNTAQRYVSDSGKTSKNNGPHVVRLFFSHRPVLKTTKTMTGGRINWAGEEHFGYSRPSGPCLDRTFNAIVSMSVGCFPSAVGVSRERPLFCWSCPGNEHRGTTEWRRPLCNNSLHHGR